MSYPALFLERLRFLVRTKAHQSEWQDALTTYARKLSAKKQTRANRCNWKRRA